MIARSRERDFQAKEEGETNEVKLSKPSSSTSSRQWSAFRNPRIVRVSRSFGGKDRHSKVCTIRGLRDRRIRLSVPTAIQLYDLQDRLGLGQPSKVIDWLLDNTRDDIDKLPPLPIPQGFGQFHHQPMLFSHDFSSSATQSSLPTLFDANSTFMKDSRLFRSFGLNVNRGLDGEDPIAAAPTRSSSRYNWDVEASLKLKSKEIENSSGDREKGKWISKVNEGNQNQGVGNYISSGHGQGLSAQNLFPSSSNSSLSGNLVNNSMSAFNPYYHWDASNLSLSQYGSHGFLPQTDTSLINTNTTATVPLPSSLTLPSGSHLFFCPPPTLPSLFPSYPPYITTPMENESREINHFALLGSNPQNLSTNSRTMKPFSLNVNPGQFHSHNSNETHPDKQNNS